MVAVNQYREGETLVRLALFPPTYKANIRSDAQVSIRERAKCDSHIIHGCGRDATLI